METIALIVRLLIAATFFVAGISKLADLRGTRKGIRDFGVPNWAASSLGIVLPLAEITVAGLLIPLSTMLWGSVGTIVLLLTFITGISINLAQGRKPNCNCFGQLHSEPVGWPTLIRNCILTGGAWFVFWRGRNGAPLSVVGWTTGLSNAEAVGILLGIAALVLIAAQGWLTFHLMRQNGRLLLRMDALETQAGGRGLASLPVSASSGLPIGSPAPAFELPALVGGSTLTLDALRAERRPIVLIFSDPDCGPCSALLPDIARWEREQAAKLTIALVSRGSQEANRVKIGELQLRYVLLQKDREVAAAYGANGTPGAVLIGIDGKIASFLAMGSQAITGLVATGAGTPLAASVASNGKSKSASLLPAGSSAELKIGHAAPPLKLPDLSGKIVDLSSFKERETLVLFWNPNCGFCAKMLPDLKRWEEDRSAEAPQLLVVSSGTVEANLAMGLRAPVVLDPTFATGLAFHVRGTPGAVLIDGKGRIASGVASGASAVFALANAQRRISV
jgi:peroxiredoxin/uncharacterized membrane protein YphA (DoxX/SURF4 family)